MNTIDTHLYLPSDLYNQIQTLAQAKQVPFAQIARELMVVGAKRHVGSFKKKNPLDWLITMKLKGPKDGSVNHDKYLYGQ